MERTQLYLPKTYKDALRREAQRRRTTVSDMVRTLIAQNLPKRRPQQRGRKAHKSLFDALCAINRLGERGPRDLAQNLDKYLYGDI